MRVALPWLGYSCGHCRQCNSGWETLCESQLNMGYSMNGGFAEYTVGNAGNVVRVPEDVDPLDAAPLTCAGVTTYKAVKVSGASASSVVAVFGAGGLGHLAIQYARVTGAAVIALEEVFELHRRGGTRAAHRVPARRRQRGHRAGSRRQRAAAAP